MHRYILLGKDTLRRSTVVLKLGGCKLEKSKIKIHFYFKLKTRPNIISVQSCNKKTTV